MNKIKCDLYEKCKSRHLYVCTTNQYNCEHYFTEHWEQNLLQSRRKQIEESLLESELELSEQ